MYGLCDDMSRGVHTAFSQAEKHSQKEKSKKKIKNHQAIFKENSAYILAEELQAMLSQLRIQVKTLTGQQKDILKDTISHSFKTAMRTSGGLLQDIKSALLLDESQNPIEERVNDLERELLVEYANNVITPKQRENYILAQILSRLPVDNVEKHDYFFRNYFSNFVPKNKQQALRKLSKQSLVSIELSGIKDINDTYGHTQCDKMVYTTISQVVELAKKQNLEKYFPMFAYGISSYAMITPSSEDEHIDELCTDIPSINSDFKLSASYTRLGDDVNDVILDEIMNNKDKTSMDLLKYLLDCANSANNEENRKIISASKIRDKSPVIRYISRNLKRITKSLGQELDEETINDALNYVLEIEAPADDEIQADYDKPHEMNEDRMP